MNAVSPENVGQLCELLRDCQHDKRSLELFGGGSKRRQGGPVSASLRVETFKLNRVLAYDPRDLTISVEAGLPWNDLDRLTAEKGQMVALDPPFAAQATVGGVLAANSSGPRRRLYGTARDLVIGMHFATLQGKLVQSGGMVVKNVAGLDFAKLLIGSFGTLAAIAVVNFKLTPRPAAQQVFLFRAPQPTGVFLARNRLLESVLQPVGLDVLNPAASESLGLGAHWSLLVEAAGSPAVLSRYEKELAGFEKIDSSFWTRLRDFTPTYLAAHPQGHVLRLSLKLRSMESALAQLPADSSIVARAGNGVAYVHTNYLLPLPPGLTGVVDFAPIERPAPDQLWPSPGSDFFLMEKIKQLHDPDHLLNPGRLYGRL